MSSSYFNALLPLSFYTGAYVRSSTTQQQQPGGGGAAQGSQELWERQPWFQAVLTSKWNDRDREAYMKNREARPTDLDMLVFFLW